MAGLAKYLIPSETVVVITRRHWGSLLKAGSLCVLAALLGVLILRYGPQARPAVLVGLVLLIGAAGFLGWKWLEWREEKFVVTDRRVLLVYGVLTRRLGIMPLSKVTDLTYERTLAGRLLGYGAFVIESAGQHQAFNRIDYLPTPDRLYRDVSMLLFPGDAEGSPGRHTYPTTPLPRHR